MKVVYAIRAIAHFPYHYPTIRSLWERGHHVRLLVCPKARKSLGEAHGIAEAVKESGGLLGVDDFGFTAAPNPSMHFLHSFRELRSYASYLRRPDQSVYYLNRYRGYLEPPWPDSLNSRAFVRLLKSSSFDWVCRRIESLTKPHPVALAYLEREQPDIVVASPTDMRYSREVEFIKAALQLEIPTVVPVLSWDNLTTKGLLPIIPDRLLAWNEEHKKQAVAIHGVPEDRVRITGAPFFDRWFSPPATKGGEAAFRSKIGLSPTKPFLLYLGSSKNIAVNEGWLVAGLQDALKADPQLRDYEIVVRPHPANLNMVAEVEERGMIVWPKSGALPDSPENISDFHASLAYSMATVGINTSGMIDAIVMDRPCIALLTPEYDKTQVESEHFQELLKSEAIYCANAPAQAAKLINEVSVLKNDFKRARRLEFIQHFIRPQGVKQASGDRAAKEIVKCQREYQTAATKAAAPRRRRIQAEQGNT